MENDLFCLDRVQHNITEITNVSGQDNFVIEPILLISRIKTVIYNAIEHQFLHLFTKDESIYISLDFKLYLLKCFYVNFLILSLSKQLSSLCLSLQVDFTLCEFSIEFRLKYLVFRSWQLHH